MAVSARRSAALLDTDTPTEDSRVTKLLCEIIACESTASPILSAASLKPKASIAVMTSSDGKDDSAALALGGVESADVSIDSSRERISEDEGRATGEGMQHSRMMSASGEQCTASRAHASVTMAYRPSLGSYLVREHITNADPHETDRHTRRRGPKQHESSPSIQVETQTHTTAHILENRNTHTLSLTHTDTPARTHAHNHAKASMQHPLNCVRRMKQSQTRRHVHSKGVTNRRLSRARKAFDHDVGEEDATAKHIHLPVVVLAGSHFGGLVVRVSRMVREGWVRGLRERR